MKGPHPRCPRYTVGGRVEKSGRAEATTERTALSYLLKPLPDQMSKAFTNAEEAQSSVCLLTSQAANCCNCSRQNLAQSVIVTVNPRRDRNRRYCGLSIDCERQGVDPTKCISAHCDSVKMRCAPRTGSLIASRLLQRGLMRWRGFIALVSGVAVDDGKR
jgi:hypothetical protein